MAFTYGFYDSVNGDRQYNAGQFGELISSLVEDGIFADVGTQLVVRPPLLGMNPFSVIVGEGLAWFEGTWTRNSTDMVIQLDHPHITYPRIDLITLVVDKSYGVRKNYIEIIKGIPDPDPEEPWGENTDTKFYHDLAFVLLLPGMSRITQGSITNRVGFIGAPLTGRLQNVNIDWLLSKWDFNFENWMNLTQAEFTTWFNEIKEILEGTPVSELTVIVENIKADLYKGWLSFPEESTIRGWSPLGPYIDLNGDLRSIISKGMKFQYEQTLAIDENPKAHYFTFDNTLLPMTTGTPTPTQIGTIEYRLRDNDNFMGDLYLSGANALDILPGTTSLQNPLNDFSLSFWMKHDTSGYEDVIYASVNSGNEDLTQISILPDGRIKFTRKTESVYGIRPLSDNLWHHVVVTLNEDYGQIYVDGELDGLGSFNLTDYVANTSHIHIGVDIAGTLFYSGHLDDLILFTDYALNENAIKNIFLKMAPIGTADLILKKNALITDVFYQKYDNYTEISFYHGNDFRLKVGETLNRASLRYSNDFAPFGFIPNKNKWGKKIQRPGVYQPNPIAGIWDMRYVTDFEIPKGSWDISLKCFATQTGTAATQKLEVGLFSGVTLLASQEILSSATSILQTINLNTKVHFAKPAYLRIGIRSISEDCTRIGLSEGSKYEISFYSENV